MHDCKATRERLNEIVVSGGGAQVMDELRQCHGCFEEYATLRGTLRLAEQALRSAAPPEDFWPGYRSRLRQRLEDAASAEAYQPAERSSAPAAVLAFFTRPLRVPVPAAAMLLVVVGASLVLAVRSRRVQVVTLPPTVVTQTVEVPITHEKIVTQVVYRDRERRDTAARRGNNLTAQRQNESERGPVNLSGFAPTNEVKLTIIKGSYRDDK